MVQRAQRQRDDGFGNRLTDHFGGRVAERPFGSGIELGNPAFTADGDDAVQGNRENGGFAGLAVPQRKRGLLCFFGRAFGAALRPVLGAADAANAESNHDKDAERDLIAKAQRDPATLGADQQQRRRD